MSMKTKDRYGKLGSKAGMCMKTKVVNAHDRKDGMAAKDIVSSLLMMT